MHSIVSTSLVKSTTALIFSRHDSIASGGTCKCSCSNVTMIAEIAILDGLCAIKKNSFGKNISAIETH